MQRTERITAFAGEIWDWYFRHKRTLPWRDMPEVNPDIRAYKILVSEVMLQQTQVSRVIIVFKRFLEQFPTMQALASASNKEVILAWRGMGYNSRALRLRDAINAVVSDHGGIFPKTMDGLLALPGLGHYTAAAVMNFAFGIPTPCIDTNIRRILHRTFVGPETGDGKWKANDKELLKLAEEILLEAIQLRIENEELRIKPTTDNSPFSILNSSFRRDAAEWHAALMDFGSLVQTKRNPQWDICPLTIKGIMVTTPKAWNRAQKLISNSGSAKQEPGRVIAGKYVPNRIIRGRVVELLRDASKPVTLEAIGKHVCIDWDTNEHQPWLDAIVTKLVKDAIVAREKKGYVLKG